MTAVYLILAAGIIHPIAEFVAQLVDEWQSTRRRRRAVLRRLGRAA